MNELGMAFSVGVIASLFSVFLSLLIGSFWKRIILPWYEERLYQGAEISGKWKTIAKYQNGSENELIYSIERNGYNVTGSVFCLSGADKGKNWVVEGYFKDLILTLSYSSKNNANLDRGSASLMLVENGEKLKGHLAYYEYKTHSMESTALELIPMK